MSTSGASSPPDSPSGGVNESSVTTALRYMATSTDRAAGRQTGSPMMRRAFRFLFATTPTPLMRALHQRGILAPIQEIRVVGRRTGIERSFYAVVAETDDGSVIGHPNGEQAHWVRNLLEAGSAVVVRTGDDHVAVRATELHGDARTAAIDAHRAAQRQPFKSIYGRGRSHILATGTYFRLDPVG